MTRPQIIRADTLDLQDKTSPTAQDHSNQPQHPAPLGVGPAAPHQQASLRRVDEERTSEEAQMQNGAWHDGNALRDDPGSDDERTVVTNGTANGKMQQDEQAVRLNGGMTGDGDDGDMQDADVEEDMDDDMMDKISSSPSIDDGGYLFPSYPATPRERRSSLPQLSSPLDSPLATSCTTINSSSPFSTTPIHFPLSIIEARRPGSAPAAGQSPNTTFSYESSSTRFSLQASQSFQDRMPSADHHQGEYAARTTGRNSDHTDSEDDCPEISPSTKQLKSWELRLQNMREDSQISLMSELDEEQALSMLQPVPRPFAVSHTSPQGPSSPNGKYDKDSEDESDSWITDSDADSWNLDPENDRDDESNDISFSEDPRYIDSGWGGECLRETEDIDFEFVYALHTFVATVEGQANATKGDTMVLLDDSNSYWWLVRVVKDSSIGYLPAEHIETPTERLARLNKHRNIDLSATMLGDTAEKSKNPLKKAMRRRNAKTVQFAAPTYVEASDYDYSSDEDNDELFGGADPTQQAQQQQQQQQRTSEESEIQEEDGLKVQPLKVGGGKNEVTSNQETEARAAANDATKEDEKSSEDLDKPLDPKVTRNGTLRNTDSFFKDENTETRKITLTPKMLQDDSSTSTTGSRERGPSLESLEKNGFGDKVKDDKKKKEKKPGMLSGLFKRKEKKPKGASLDSIDSDVEKQSEEINRSSPQPKPSDDLAAERAPTEQPAATAPQRQSSKGKLQKQQRPRDDSPPKKGILKTDSPEPATVQSAGTKEAPNDKPATQQATSTMRLVQPEQQEEPTKPAAEDRTLSPETRSKTNKLNPMNVLKGQPNDEPRPEKVKKAKQRVQLDDFDSEDDVKADPFADPDAQNNVRESEDSEPAGRLSESPVHITAADAQPQEREMESDSQHPPGLTGDTSSQETSSPVSTPTPDDSPSTTGPGKPNLSASHSASVTSPTSNIIPPPSRPAPIPTKEMEVSPPVSSESTTLPAWSDASLRTYLEDGSDIRDMLVVINDTTGVVPVGPEHPIMSQLFVEETKTVKGLSGQLDTLLNGLLEKRMKKLGMDTPKTSGMKVAPGRY